MFDILKKTILAGVGATVTTAEKVEEVLNEYVEKGKMTADEAKEATSKIIEDSRKEYEEARKNFNASFYEMLNKASVVTKDQLDALEKRVKALEDQAHEHDEA